VASGDLGVLTLLWQCGMMIAAVATNSFARRWSYLAAGRYTSHWYSALSEFQLDAVLVVTVVVGSGSVLLSLFSVCRRLHVGAPDFAARRLCCLLFLLPLNVARPLTYGIPLANVHVSVHLAGTPTGVIIANLIPARTSSSLVMMPFVEQIDPNIESAAASSGRPTAMFRHALVRCSHPAFSPRHAGAGASHAMFELTFLGRTDTQTTWLSLSTYAVFAAGSAAAEIVDAWPSSTWQSPWFGLLTHCVLSIDSAGESRKGAVQNGLKLR